MTQQEIAHHQNRSRRSAEEILDAAVAVISDHGLAAFTMNTVATKAGGSVGRVYARYANKEALLFAVKDRAFSQLENTLESRLAASDTGKDAIAEFVRTVSETLFAAPKLFSFMVSHSAEDAELHGRGFAFHQRSRSLLIDCLARFDISNSSTIGHVYEMVVQSLLMRVISLGANEDVPPYPGFPKTTTYQEFLIETAVSRLTP